MITQIVKGHKKSYIFYKHMMFTFDQIKAEADKLQMVWSSEIQD